VRLNSDNREQMPITDSVYGKPPGRAKDATPDRRPQVERAMWRAVDQHTLDHLAEMGRDTKRLAARRRQEES